MLGAARLQRVEQPPALQRARVLQLARARQLRPKGGNLPAEPGGLRKPHAVEQLGQVLDQRAAASASRGGTPRGAKAAGRASAVQLAERLARDAGPEGSPRSTQSRRLFGRCNDFTLPDLQDELLGLAEADWTGPPPPPRANYSTPQREQPFSIVNQKQEAVGRLSSVSVAEFVEPCPLPIFGDMRIEVADGSGDDLFHFWFHSGMLAGREHLVRRKWMLDGLKDRKHKKFDAHFSVVLDFLRVAPPGIQQSSQQSLGALL